LAAEIARGARRSGGTSSGACVAGRRYDTTLEKAIGFVAVGNAAAAPGLAGKLPHYGKYSYLVFEGDEPKNTVKGEWSADDSP